MLRKVIIFTLESHKARAAMLCRCLGAVGFCDHTNVSKMKWVSVAGGSTLRLARRAGELARSTSAAQTANMIFGSRIYLSQSEDIFSFKFSGCSREEI